MSIYPEPWTRIEKMLRQYGGWSRMFSRSAMTYDADVIWYRQNEQGFWMEWAKVKADEQFREEVENCVLEYREVNGIDRPIKELRVAIARALMQEKWRPVISRIKKEMADLKRSYKADMEALSNTNIKKDIRREKCLNQKRIQRARKMQR